MSIAEQLDAASGTNRLVLVEFYADWSPIMNGWNL